MNFIETILAQVKADAAKHIFLLLSIFLDSVSKNQSALNIGLSLAALNNGLLMAGPAVLQDLQQQVAAALEAHLQTLEQEEQVQVQAQMQAAPAKTG